MIQEVPLFNAVLFGALGTSFAVLARKPDATEKTFRSGMANFFYLVASVMALRGFTLISISTAAISGAALVIALVGWGIAEGKTRSRKDDERRRRNEAFRGLSKTLDLIVRTKAIEESRERNESAGI